MPVEKCERMKHVSKCDSLHNSSYFDDSGNIILASITSGFLGVCLSRSTILLSNNHVSLLVSPRYYRYTIAEDEKPLSSALC